MADVHSRINDFLVMHFERGDGLAIAASGENFLLCGMTGFFTVK
jgi:hypothetical protein